MRRRIAIILLWLPLLFARPVIASEPDPGRPIKQMRHTSWNEASGLSGSIYTLAQTTDGFLWIGTSTGLYRFDGLKFEPFRELADHPILEVSSLLPTSDGGLWIGYRNGVAFLKQDQASLYAEQQGLPYGRVRSLAQTRDGAIWAAVVGGLARLFNGRWERIRNNWNYPAISADRLFVDSAGTLWVAGGQSLHFLRRESRTFQQLAIKISDSTELCEGPDGSVWVADTFAHRLLRFQKSPQKGYLSASPSLPQDINEIRFGGAHSLWIATDQGLFRVLPGSLGPLSTLTVGEVEKDQFLATDGLSSREANTILEDREGNIWIGTTNGLDRFSDRSVIEISIGHTPTHLIAGPFASASGSVASRHV